MTRRTSNLYALPSSRRRIRSGSGGFTMVEIAIAIAIVAFALTAIIGVMPTGLQVQRENREDTIINQDAQLWLEAIRNGQIHLDYLTNHVLLIQRIDAKTTRTFFAGKDFYAAHHIIGLLTYPQYMSNNPNLPPDSSRRAVAIVRALTGTAAEQSPIATNVAFLYQLTVQIAPPVTGYSWNTNMTEFHSVTKLVRQSNYLRTRTLQYYSHEIRLDFRWPVVWIGQGRYRVGRNHRVYRTLALGVLSMLDAPEFPLELYRIQPLRMGIIR